MRSSTAGRLDDAVVPNPSPLVEIGSVIKKFNELASRSDRGFAPVAEDEAELLILGSLPGQRSLEVREYYAHPRNEFWRLIEQIFDVESSLPYRRRVETLTAKKIALWDVLAAAERPGSLDSSIVRASAQANDFAAFYRAHPRINRVCFNGRKAQELYARLVLPGLPGELAGLRYVSLPSTSPAHAGMPFAEKLVRWKIIKERAP